MSRQYQQYQDKNYRSGRYSTPSPNPSHQTGQQYPQSQSQPQSSAYNSGQQSQRGYPPYPEGSSLQPPPSGQGHGGHSPYARAVSFPEPQLQVEHSSTAPQPYIPPSPTMPNLTEGTRRHDRQGPYGHPSSTASSTGLPQPYIPPSPTMPNLTEGSRRHDRQGPYGYPSSTASSTALSQPYIPPPSPPMPNLTEGTRRHDRQGSYGHPPPAALSSENRQFYRSERPDTGGSSNIYSQSGGQPHSGGGYPATNPQHQDWAVTPAASGHDEREYQDKVPPGGSPVASYSRPRICRLRGCNNQALFDRRINELREWCSDQHMHEAIVQRMEKSCKICQIWPRRNGYKHCCGDVCRYPGIQPISGYRPLCRYPRCNNYVFVDTRLNRHGEWCGDGHMREAIARQLEYPCRRCRIWPCWRNFEFCGGDVCIYPY